MALVDNVISKAREYIGVSENPPESNNVVFNTDYYGREVFDNGSATCKPTHKMKKCDAQNENR